MGVVTAGAALAMGPRTLAPLPTGHLIADMSDDASVASSHGRLEHGELSRLAALDRYWSERTALISTHHHRELAAAQSAVKQAGAPKRSQTLSRKCALSCGSLGAVVQTSTSISANHITGCPGAAGDCAAI